LQKALSVDGATYAPSAGAVISSVESFFGALRELGLDPSQFRLAYLADDALLEVVREHLEKRLGGFTGSLSKMYTFTTGLLLQDKDAGDVGFIVQQPEYVYALPTRAELTKVITNSAQLDRVFRDDRDENSPPVERPSPEQFQALTAKEQKVMWRIWCAHNRQLMLSRKRQVEKDGRLLEETRDRRAIQKYLDWSEPIVVLTNLARTIRKVADEERYTLRGDEYLNLERAYLFVEIEINQPLRIENMAHLTYDSDNTGNLHRRYDPEGNFECWAIRLEVNDFKNWRTLAKKKKKYDLPLPKKLNDVINRWVDELLREYGYQGKGRFYVFPMIREWYKVDSDGEPLLGADGKRILKEDFPFGKPSTRSLGTAFRRATIEYVPDCAKSGFGPHACRHIVATHIIKNVTRMDPFLAASLVLHDEVETVRNEYGHVRANDGSNAHQEQLDAFYEVYYAAENDEKKSAQRLSSLEAENARLQAELAALRLNLNGGAK
jgi:integrase